MARQLLPRMELLVLKDLSATDPAQVPAAATIQLHRQGATLSATAMIGPYWADYVVGVYDAGELATNDVVRVGTGPNTLIVGGVESATEVLLTNPTGTPVTLLPGTRLVPTANSPGRSPIPTGTSRSVQPSSPIRQPAGLRSTSRATGWTTTWRSPDSLIQKPNVTLLGEGASSVIRPASGLVNVFDLITVERPNFQLAELIVDGGAHTSYSNPRSCIVASGPAHSGQSVAGMTLRNVIVASAPNYGLWLRAAGGFLAKGCFFSFNQGSGVRINEGNGVEARDCDRLALRSCYFENADTPARTAQFLLLDGCPGAIVEGAWFQGGPQSYAPKWPKRAVRFANAPGSRLGACGMENMMEHEARFDAMSSDCVEFGTRVLKIGVAIARIETVGQRIFSLSRRSLGIPAHAAESSLPSGANVRQGSLAWSDTLLPGHYLHFRVHDGSTWRGLIYDQS